MKRVYGWAGVRYVTTKFSQMDSLPNFLTHGAPLCARFARARSSAITKLWNLFVLLSHLVVSPVHNLLNSFFIKPCSPLWLIQWGGRILHMDFSIDLSLSQVKVTVPITPGRTPDWRLNGGKNQNPKKSLDQNLTPQKSHAEFPSHKISRQQRQSQNKFGFTLYLQN